MNKRIRQYLGLLAAIAVYYLVHEGAHLVMALFYGTFKQINFMGLGVQIDVYAERMTDAQLGLFCLAGPAAALLASWVLIGLTKRICSLNSKLFKTIMWYTSLAILLRDPLYLSVLCGFFGRRRHERHQAVVPGSCGKGYVCGDWACSWAYYLEVPAWRIYRGVPGRGMTEANEAHQRRTNVNE